MSTAIDQIFKDKVLGHPAGIICAVFYRNVGAFFILWNAGTTSHVFHGFTYG
jgi:hypothetical protein